MDEHVVSASDPPHLHWTRFRVRTGPRLTPADSESTRMLEATSGRCVVRRTVGAAGTPESGTVTGCPEGLWDTALRLAPR